MAIKEIIGEIEKEVIDVTKTSFDNKDTNFVPNLQDGELTYESGKEKRGKRIQTCVLYVDIRNSVALTEKHHTQTMGRIYTAFTKAVLKVARYHGGHTRNIIGDRVMIVFPSNDCFTKAVDCAISINHIAKYVINKQFPGVDFKCGIGIAHGELRVIKVGIQRYGTENGENKGLVWVGYPANIASRLTDVANKQMQETTFNISFHPKNPTKLLNMFFGLKSINTLGGMPFKFDPYAPDYLDKIEQKELSKDEFIENISKLDNGNLFFKDGKIIGFTKNVKNVNFPPILMTHDVYNGFKKANLERASIKKELWEVQQHKIKNVSGKVFGGDIHWILN